MHQNSFSNAVFGYKFRAIYYSLFLIMLLLAMVNLCWLLEHVNYILALYIRPRSYPAITYLTVTNTLVLFGYLTMLAMIPIRSVGVLHSFYEEIGEEPPKPLPSLRKAVVMLFVPLLNFLWGLKLLYDLNFLLNDALLRKLDRKSKVNKRTFKNLAQFLILAFVFALICCCIVYFVRINPSDDEMGSRIGGLFIQLYGSISGSISLLFLSLGIFFFHTIIHSIIRICNDLQSNGVPTPSVTKPVLICTIVVGLVLLVSTAIFQILPWNRL